MQPVTALPPGTVLGENEKYKILGVCGQGGFGITYVGWDTSLERNVAIKECFPQEICVRDGATAQIVPRMPALEDAYLMAMADLQREARLLAKLNHPNIVQVHDVFAAHGSLFCVMRWLEGETLRMRLDTAEAEDAPLPAEQAEDWLRQLLDALSHMHAQGIIHRDIKPENIMFDDTGRPVLVDFGSAVNLSHLTHTLTQGAFSAAYAAPEQISGKGKIGPWTDFYSLACTWYEVFSNCAPEQTLRRMAEDSLEPLAKLVPERVQAAPRLAAGIMCNLELPAAARCQSAADWLSVLDGKRQPRRPLRKGRRRPWLWAAGVAAALGFLTAPLLMPDKAPPPPSVEVQEGEPDIDALTDRAWEYYEMGKLVEKRRQGMEELQGILARYREQCARLGERCLPSSSEEDIKAVKNEFQQASKDTKAEIQALEARYEKEFLNPYEQKRESMESGTGWPELSYTEKLALMHTVSSRVNTRLFKECGTYNLYSLDASDDFDTIRNEFERELQELESDARSRHTAETKRREREQREERTRQENAERAKNTEALYQKVHAQSGMVELMQKADRMKQEYADIAAEGLKAMERIADEGIGKAKAAAMDDVSKIDTDTDSKILACEREFRKKMSDFRERFRTEVAQPLRRIIDNCSYSSKFSFVTEEEKKLLSGIEKRISGEIEPYRGLPHVAAPDADVAREKLRREVKLVQAQKEAERDAAVEALYRKVVDGQKLDSFRTRRAEIERKSLALHKEFRKEINAYVAKVVPQIKAMPRKQWDAAIEAAEQRVAQIGHKYNLQEKPLVEESQKVASAARSYLNRIENARGSEFAGLTAEEKALMPRVEYLARVKVDGGEYQMEVTVPMMEGSFILGEFIEDRVYKDVDMDALQQEEEEEAMEELGL